MSKAPKGDGVACQGVHRASAKSKGRSSQLYRASVCFWNLMLLSRSTSLDRALDFHAVLLLVRMTLLERWRGKADICDDKLAFAVEQTVDAACESMTEKKVDLGLSYRP